MRGDVMDHALGLLRMGRGSKQLRMTVLGNSHTCVW